MAKRSPDAKPYSKMPMKINQFFRDVLHAPPNNPRWSWGAYDAATHTVFLRLWVDNQTTIDGRLAVHVFESNPKATGTRLAAKNERAEQIRLIRDERAKGYAVMCVSTDSERISREIASYDDKTLLEIDGFVDGPKGLYATIKGEVSASEVWNRPTAWSDEASDIEQIRRDPSLTPTKKRALIDARIGQGKFRQDLLRLWRRACAVTGCSFEPLLRASHIKPWRIASNEERLDPNNGLLLAAHLDALFDRGHVTFSDNGVLLFSKHLPLDARELVGVTRSLRFDLNDKQREYLRYHRKALFEM